MVDHISCTYSYAIHIHYSGTIAPISQLIRAETSNRPSVHSIPAACLVSYATETVMQICHGRRRCALSADTGTFGNPCRSESRMYLKTVYTCGE